MRSAAFIHFIGAVNIIIHGQNNENRINSMGRYLDYCNRRFFVRAHSLAQYLFINKSLRPTAKMIDVGTSWFLAYCYVLRVYYMLNVYLTYTRGLRLNNKRYGEPGGSNVKTDSLLVSQWKKEGTVYINISLFYFAYFETFLLSKIKKPAV